MIDALRQNLLPAFVGLCFTVFMIFFLMRGMRKRLGITSKQLYEIKPWETLVAITLWLCIAAGFALLIGSLNVPTYYRLVTHAQTTMGSIIKIDPANHCSATYEFSLNNQTYTGGDARCGVNVGDKLTVYYNPNNLADSTTYEPNGALLNELIPIGLVCLIAPTLIVYQLFLFGILGRRKIDLSSLPYD